MRRMAMLLVLFGAIHCGSTQTPPSAAEATEVASDESGEPAMAAQPDTEPGDETPPSACKPSETEEVPPTTEPVCGPEVCLEGEPGGLATCIDTKHKGCTHYLLARVSPDRTTEPLSVYIRCPSGAEKGKPRGAKLEGTLMKSYAETGVPSLPDESKPPAKPCIHIFAIDCPTEP